MTFIETINQTVDVPLWAALLVPAVIGGFGWLRGWCDGKGMKL